MKSRKRRYIQNTELRLHLTIAPDEEKEVDYEILDRKYPIKEWKTECLGTKPQIDQAEHIEEINQNVVIRNDLNDVYQLVMDRYQDEIPEGFDRVLWGDLMVMFNPDDKDEFWNSHLDWIIVSWKLHSSSGVHTLVTETGLVIHMLVEKKYPLRKEVLMQMLKLKLESEEDNTMALELIKFVKKILAEHKNWLVHKQTACGKDFSNPFMVDNLPKIVGLSTHLASVVKSWLVHDQTVHALASPKANELAIPEQTATGKGTSNPLMAEKTKLLLKKDRVYKFKKWEDQTSESNVESQPKVWSDAPIIEEYESDSEDECVSIPIKQQATPSFANQQVKTPRENVKSQNTHSLKPKVDKKELGHGFAVRYLIAIFYLK
ncbi:hypothetical protein Tco_0984246 [Tanacetum coccineum]